MAAVSTHTCYDSVQCAHCAQRLGGYEPARKRDQKASRAAACRLHAPKSGQLLPSELKKKKASAKEHTRYDCIFTDKPAALSVALCIYCLNLEQDVLFFRIVGRYGLNCRQEKSRRACLLLLISALCLSPISSKRLADAPVRG